MRPNFLTYLFLLFIFGYSAVSAQHLHIAEIHIDGNKKTRASIILRELPFAVNDSLPESEMIEMLQLAKNQLVNLNLFNVVEVNSERRDNKNIGVRISVVEKWYFWPIPSLEYADRNVNQWYSFSLNPERINYGLYSFRYNAFGLNHTFKLSLIHGYTRHYGVEYRIPYIDKKKHWGVAVQANVRRNHEMVFITSNNRQQFFKDPENDVNQRNTALLSLSYRPHIFTRYQINGGFYRQQVSDTILQLNEAFNESGNILKIAYTGVDVSFQKTNNRNYPTKGMAGNASIQFNAIPGSLHRWMDISAGIEKYQPLSEKISLAMFAGGRIRPGKNIPYPVSSALGYRYYVRGFEPFVMDGPHYFLFKGEFRYNLLNNKIFNLGFVPLKNYRKTITSSQWCLFSDLGYVRDNNIPMTLRNDLVNRWVAGAGIGWNWVFYFDKVVRFEYSVNHRGEFYGNIHFTKPF